VGEKRTGIEPSPENDGEQVMGAKGKEGVGEMGGQ
jgi:hypothetical protein